MADTTTTTVFYECGESITCKVTAAVTAGTFVKVTGTKGDGNNVQVGPCTAGAAALGVALYSQATVGGLVGVRLLNSGGVFGVTVGTGGVTYGQEIESDATGKAVALSAGKSLGMALDTVAATGTCPVAIGR